MSINAAGGTAPQVPSIPPNQTLYIKNLDPRIKKEGIYPNQWRRTESRSSTGALLSLRHIWYVSLLTVLTAGPVLDVVCTKSGGMRGQAHVVFRDVVTSTTAMRALQNFIFLEREMVLPQSTNSNTSTFHMQKGKVISSQNWMERIVYLSLKRIHHRPRVRSGQGRMSMTVMMTQSRLTCRW